MSDHLLQETIKIIPVPYSSAQEYSEKADLIKAEVDQTLTACSEIYQMIGKNPLSVMYDNHGNHVAFMSNIFKLNDYELMSRVIVWVYHTYHSQGFSFDYFPFALNAWIEAVAKHLESSKAEPIREVYRWIIKNHELFIDASHRIEKPPHIIDHKWLELKETFLSSLLEGSHRKAVELSLKNVHSSSDITEFYLQVIQAAMYDIGNMWENGEISVAREHLASAIVTRVMASLYPKFIILEQTKSSAIVTAAPNEYHEIGPRMVADMLEMDGWDINYTGANTPPESIVDLALAKHPFFIAISVGMPFNIDRTQTLIKLIREQKQLNDTKIMVGGQCLKMSSQIRKAIGADGSGDSARDAVLLASEWWNYA